MTRVLCGFEREGRDMEQTGFKWVLRQAGSQWEWQAIGRDDGVVHASGLAGSRAEGAAYLARTMALGVLGLTPLAA